MKEDPYKKAIIADAMLMFEFNLTQNLIVGEPVQWMGDRVIQLKKSLGLPEECKYMDFIEAVCWDMSETEKKKFIEKMNIYCLIDSFIMEKYEIQFDSKREAYGGEFFWTRNTIILTKDDETGDILGLSVVKNITSSYRQKEEKLYQLEVINALTVEYANVFMVNLISCKIRIVRMNDKEGAFYNESLEGFFYDDALDFYVSLYVYEDDRYMMREAFSTENIVNQLTTRESFNVRYRFCLNDKISYMKLTIVRIGNIKESGNFLMGFTNVDEETEREMKQRADMQKALSMAEAASKAKSSFLSNMSHDIRTPMNAIIGFTTLAEKHIDNQELVKADLEKIKSSSSYLLSLINDVLDMSRIESGKIKLKLGPCTLDEILKDVDTVIKAQLQTKPMNYSVTCNGSVSKRIICDKLRINQVLINILGNAVKYTPENGKIEFTITETESTEENTSYSFSVKDNGIGMSEEFQAKMFVPFERGENKNSVYIQGTGLGLAISKSLIEMMDGSISVKSKENEGSEFVVGFTFENVTENSSVKDKKESSDEPAKEVYNFKGLRILLVEDNSLNREIARELLKNVGFIIDEAENGKIALQIIEDAPEDYYNLILMDVMMPVMGGHEASKRIRALENKTKASIPIIAMTANAFEEDKNYALQCGMDYFVSKPFDINELLRILNYVITKKTKTEKN